VWDRSGQATASDVSLSVSPLSRRPPEQARRPAQTDVGLQLIDNTTAGIGVVVLHVVAALPAALAGLHVGHVIQSIDGELAWDHKSALQRISALYAAQPNTLGPRPPTAFSALFSLTVLHCVDPTVWGAGTLPTAR
jgi:S1-C subfamily serine protease